MRKLITLTAAVLMARVTTELLQAQLAITEVMADSSPDLGATFRGPDYWELTNFGTNEINLQGYGFSDDKIATVFTGAFENLAIKGGESIILCRLTNPSPFVKSREDFIAWWGERNLPANLQIRFYNQPGLNGDGDQLWLRDPAGNVVDSVKFGTSTPGRAMTYDTVTGFFGRPSDANAKGSFRAASSTNDVGSPGSTTGRVSLGIQTQPESQTVDSCGGVQFSVEASGMPRPSYQWISNGIPVPGVSGPMLHIPNVGPSASGDYQVRLSNGFEERLSDVAKLAVNTHPLAPQFVLQPIDVTLFPGQTGRFSAEIRGYPCARLQWQSNSVALTDETNLTLVLPIPIDALPHTALYTLTASNDVGTVSASARLVIIKLPCLRITEVMSSPTNEDSLNHKGWFELTNCGAQEANLQDYRFRDAAQPEVAFIITNQVIVLPGESVVFVESMSREEFVDWWGADQLPPGLQVVTWRGWGLSKTTSDTLHIWNSSPNDGENSVATASYLDAIPGFSQETANLCDEMLGCAAGYLRESILWEGGAFPASVGGDIGSPGYTENPPLRVLKVSVEATRVDVRCRVVAGKTYRLDFKKSLADADWMPLAPEIAKDSVSTLQDDPPGGTLARYYRVEELP